MNRLAFRCLCSSQRAGRSLCRLRGPVYALVAVLLFSSVPALAAAVPVEESTASGRGGSAQLSELFYQLQVMQQEVQTLRGIVEEQSHLLQRLQKDQKEQYIDLDGRLAALSRGAPVGGSAGASQPANAGAAAAGAVAGARPGGTAASQPAAAASGEQADYNNALKLLRERQYDDALRGFNRLLSDYPGGQYTGNSLYWLGELYLVKDQSERARAQFVQVIDLYSDHPKVPDALYKLGVTYHRLGDKHQALEYLNRVRGQYPSHSAAKLAADYAREMQ
ncbi:MAG: tol-pal system protein YbgF [Pseudomonadales bacterium]